MSEAPPLPLPLPPGITLANTLGCIEMSIVLNALFLGVVCMQFLTYCQEQKDGWPLRCMVWYIFILDIAHSMVVTELLWKLTITNFGNPLALLETNWEYAFTVIFIALTVIPIQLFLGWRVKRLSANKMVGLAFFVLIILMSMGHGAAGIYLTAYAMSANITVDGFERFVSIGIAWSALSFATDTIVNLALVYTLYSRRTGFKSSDNLITRIISVTVLSGIPLTVFGFGHTLSIKLGVITGIPYIFAVPVGRVYSNTLLTTLNSRSKIRSSNNTQTSDGINIIDTAFAQRLNARSTAGSGGIGQGPLKIQVSQSRDIKMDDLGDSTHGSNGVYKGNAL